MALFVPFLWKRVAQSFSSGKKQMQKKRKTARIETKYCGRNM
ncbi:hypothetical protein HMPREF7215_0619 [Pyramidobacter piscolens W5455]|uniref:Uncharacterized protein n=1 Tax=Pyramidobacter piscolens W5455 TaxID=352165 RepID=A0ABP2HUX6_9BACT|nr:hypothetical protein HMPREF7215_0619 [Pyramidobacter piscolens W5455]